MKIAIADYIGSVQTEINPSDHYKKDVTYFCANFLVAIVINHLKRL